MKHLVAGAWLLVITLGAAPAFAQSAFVQGGIALDARRFSGAEDRVFDATIASVAIGGGGFLTPIFSTSVELDLGRESAHADSTSITIAGRPETITTTVTSRRRSVSALFGVHSSSQRAVRVGAYAGLAFTAFDQTISTDAPPVVLSSPPPPSEFTHLGAVPVVGADVAIAVSRQFAVVAMVRAQSLALASDLHGFSIRPGVAARIIF